MVCDSRLVVVDGVHVVCVDDDGVMVGFMMMVS